MVLQHNLTALNAQRQYNITAGSLAKSSEKLASGYRINRAADDAAGLAISEKMRRQIRGLTQASENAKDGISMVQTADGAMAEIDDMLHRGTELAIKAANGTMSASDRADIQKEIEQIKSEIDQIPERTKFNEIYVLKGGVAGVSDEGAINGVINRNMPASVSVQPTSGVMDSSVYPGYTAGAVDFSGYNKSRDYSSLIGKGFYATCCTCTTRHSIQFTDSTTNEIEEMPRNEQGNPSYVYKIGIANCNTGEEIVDAILAGTNNGDLKKGNSSHFTQMKEDPSNPARLIIYDNRSGQSPDPDREMGLFGTGVYTGEADSSGTTTLSWKVQDDISLQIGADNLESNRLTIELPAISSALVGIENVDVRSTEGAYTAIDSFADALFYVNDQRSRMGAYQNRLEHTIANLDNVIENTTAAESVIRDTNMSTEMVRYSMLNILAQAGEAMMAQSNNMNEGVLSLLQ